MESWIKVTPESGTGNGNVAISADAHTGRVARSGTVKIQNQNGVKPSKNITVSQTAKDEFLSKLSITPIKPNTIPAAGGKVNISIKSNSNAIDLYFESESFPLTPENVIAKINNVVQTVTTVDEEFGVTISTKGDIGANGEYVMDIEITIPPSTVAGERSYGFSVTLSSNTDIGFMVEGVYQAGNTSTLSVNKEAVSLVTAGTAQTVAVTSNDDWKVS